MASLNEGRGEVSSENVPFAKAPMAEPTMKDTKIDGENIKSSVEREGEAVTFQAVETEDGAEYEVYDNYEDAEREAIKRVERDLDDDPSMFSQEWLQNHAYISDTDKRIIAGEEADARLDGEEFENDEEREAKYDEIYEEVHQKLKDDPHDYFVNELGAYSDEDYYKASFVQIDTREAARDAVQTDGVAHFLNHYDGNEIEMEDGRYAYRTN